MFKQTKYRIRQYDNKNVALTPKQRAFMKKIGNKQLRKQHEQILKEGLLNLADDLSDYSHCMWEIEDVYEDSYDYYLEQNPEYDDENYDDFGYEDDYANWDYDPYDYDPYWGDDRITREEISQLAQDKVVITKEDCGKTLGQLMRKYLLIN